ncbi:MAG: type II secretion system major pseudopilin GspG [Verrucomicrobiota bacterium]
MNNQTHHMQRTIKSTLARRRSQRATGFTLIEIMLVLGIISLLLGMAVFMLGDVLGSSKYVVAEADVKAIQNGLRAYELVSKRLPTTDQGLAALVEKPTKAPVPRQWHKALDEVPRDPWGSDYQFRNPGIKNPRSYDLFSLGEDGVESDDDIGNWTE